MVEINLSESAWEDLDNIATYIGFDSPRYALEYTENILNHITILYDFPRSGRIVPEFGRENLRELIYGNYRIIYEIQNEELISVVRISHSARLLNL